MSGDAVLDLAREGIWVMIMIGAPMMIVGLLVGVVIALFQALTQIQEQTLAFIPKILVVFLVLLLTLPFMADALAAFMVEVSERIVAG